MVWSFGVQVRRESEIAHHLCNLQFKITWSPAWVLSGTCKMVCTVPMIEALVIWSVHGRDNLDPLVITPNPFSGWLSAVGPLSFLLSVGTRGFKGILSAEGAVAVCSRMYRKKNFQNLISWIFKQNIRVVGPQEPGSKTQHTFWFDLTHPHRNHIGVYCHLAKLDLSHKPETLTLLLQSILLLCLWCQLLMWRFFQTSTILTQVHPNAIHMLGIQCSTGITYSWCVHEALQPVLVVLYYCFNLNLARGAGFCTWTLV
jgi:hypothetical protein